MSTISRLYSILGASLFGLLAWFSCASALEGEWTDLNPESPERITSEHLFDVDFVNRSTGLAVGAHGTILLTTDRGTTWVAAASGTAERLDRVDFIDATHATAVGANGTILRSSDGGTTWIAQPSGTTQSLHGVYFSDALTGWAVGEAGTMLRTTDGGSNWIAGGSGTTLDLFDVTFINAQRGYIVGRGGTLLQTNSGGDGWTPRTDVKVCYNDHGVQQCNGFYDVYFLDDQIGFLVGYDAYPVLLIGGAFFRTTDGGNSWLRPPFTVPDLGFDNEVVVAVAFGNATEGIALGGGAWPPVEEGSRAYHTLDAGATWSEIFIPIVGSPSALCYGDENTAYAVGYGGTIIRWDRERRPVNAHLDVKPGSCPNRLNLKLPKGGKANGGVLPVAVLGSSEFDVRDIDVSSLELEGTPPLRYRYEDVATPQGGDNDCACSERGADGYTDLTLKFARLEVVSRLGGVSGEDVPVTLTGRMKDGTQIELTDCVRIVPQKDENGPRLASANFTQLTTLGRATPNPFNPTTVISYELARRGYVTLKVYDVKGELVTTLVDGELPGGRHEAVWEAEGIPSGVYFYRLCAGSFNETRKVVLLK